TDVLYIQSASSTDAPDLPATDASGAISDPKGWSTKAPEWAAGKFIWQTTYVRKGDGAASFSAPTCISGRDGASYAPNLLRKADKELSSKNYLIGIYDYDEKPEVGATYTLTLCYQCGPDTDAIRASHYGSYTYDPTAFTSKSRVIESKVFTIQPHGATVIPAGMYFYSTPYKGAGADGTYDDGSVVYWAVLQKGDTRGSREWLPAASEMVGRDGVSYSPNMLLKSEEATTYLATAQWGPQGKLYFDNGVSLKQGDTLALSIEGIENLSGNASEYTVGIYDEQAQRFLHADLNVTAAAPDKVFTITHTPADMDSCCLYIYAGRNGAQTGNRVRYTRIMIARGTTPMPWSPAASEMVGKDGAGYAPNLLSETRNWGTGWLSNGFHKDGTYEGLAVLSRKAPATGIADIWYNPGEGIELKNDTVYTLSVWAKGQGEFRTYVYPGVTARILSIDGVPSASTASDTAAQHTLTSEWKRYFVIFRTLATGALTKKYVIPARLYSEGSEIWVAGAKLSEGADYAPVWAPTPSEMAAVSIRTITEQYYLSTSRFAPEGGAWSDTRPEWIAGRFYWTRSKITYTDDSVEYAGEICATGESGQSYAPNLLKNSEQQKVLAAGSTNYSSLHYYFDTPVDFKVGEKYTFSIGSIENLAGDPTEYSALLYDVDTSSSISGLSSTFTQAAPYATMTIAEARDKAPNVRLLLYAGKAGATAGNTVRYAKVMLVKGTAPMPWSPAASEMVGKDGQYTVHQWAKSSSASSL
ncbi:MAG: hypothetical protein K2O63_04445, partial [Alistipes sp.]|nr:hypothetical protein [Alistipes sp.]